MNDGVVRRCLMAFPAATTSMELRPLDRFDDTAGWDQDTSEARYAAELERLRLVATVRTEPPDDFLPGMAFDVSPAVGSRVAPGSTAVVTLSE